MSKISNHYLTLNLANQIIAATLEMGHQLSLAPLAVAVLDPGGHLLAFQREDRASILRPKIATGKAFSALAMGFSSRKIGEMAAERPSFIASLSGVSPQGIIPVAGGLLIGDQEQNIIGAIGVSGDSSDNDEKCASSGIKASGLIILS